VSSSPDTEFERRLSLLTGSLHHFTAWAESEGEETLLGRVRQEIASTVRRVWSQFHDLAFSHVTEISETSLEAFEAELLDSLRSLRLKKMQSLDYCAKVISWIQNEFRGILRRYLNRWFVAEEHLDAIDSAIDAQGLNELFKSATIRQVSEGERSPENLLGDVQLALDEVIRLQDEAARNKAEAASILRRVEEIAGEATEAQQKYKSAQSQLEVLNEDKSAKKLIEHFGLFSAKHDANALKYFRWGIGVFIGVATFAVTVTYLHSLEPTNWAALAWKVAIVGGLSAIGTYLLRQSSYHRQLAVWSDTVQVQLQTFTPYIGLIGERSSKDQLRMEFARRVFGTEPGAPDSSKESTVEMSSMAELSTLIANVAKLQAPKA